MTDFCKISLKPLTAHEADIGYKAAALRTLLGSTRISPKLSFSRSEFFQNSRQYSQGMSISGVQQKLSLKIDDQRRLSPTAEGGEFILKPSPEAYPYAAENEHAAMQLSKLLGIETAHCGLVSFTGDELAYITRRFDRTEGHGKAHQEDLLQCFNIPSEEKYRKTYEDAGKLLHLVTGGKQAVVLDFLRRVIFAYLTGNDDLHLKNLSVQRLPGNTSIHYDKLTPNYDCLFCDALSDNDNPTGLGQLALGLLRDPADGEEQFSVMHAHYGYYTGFDFIELGKRLGLPEKAVLKFIGLLDRRKTEIIDLIHRSYMPKQMQQRAAALVTARLGALRIIAQKD